MVNFYRRHIPNCSSIAKPLSRQTGSKNIVWDQNCQVAFNRLKELLVDPKLLTFPDYSREASPLELHVFASSIGAGAVLSQKQNKKSRPICFMSMTFSNAQQRYSTIERELAALRWAVKTLRPFLCSNKFIIYTDHQPLIYLQNMSNADSRIARTLEELSEFNFEIKHISGIRNVVADGLSRSPIPSEESDEDNSTVYNNYDHSFVPSGFIEIVIPGGGNSLFRCFSLWKTDSQDSHVDIREQVLDEIIKNPSKYKLHGRNINKLLKAMHIPGHMPIEEVILAFAILNKVNVVVYYSNLNPIKYGEDFNSICTLKCLAEIHYNYLKPIVKEEKIVKVNLIRINNVNIVDPCLNFFKNSELDLDFLKEVQSGDKVISRIKNIVKNQIDQINWHISIKSFKPYIKKLLVQDSILYFIKDQNKILVVVPFDFLITIVLKLHIDFAHLGRNKLLDLVYRELWHPRVNQVVSDVCRSCPVCQQNKVFSNFISPPILKISSSFPFDLCAVDLLKLPVTSRGHNYCLVFIDHFTKFVAVVPLRNKQGSSVVNALKFRILPFLPRIPNRILSDNGTEFVNSDVNEMLTSFGIRHVTISPYMASCNGICERFNRSIIQTLRILVEKHVSDWDLKLPSAIVIYNNTVHSSTGSSPSEFILTTAHENNSNVCLQQFWRQPPNKFSSFQVGDKVAYKVQQKGNLLINKFQERAIGPFIIVHKFSNNMSFLIKQDSADTAEQPIKAHLRQLRKWFDVPRYLMRM